MVVSVRGLHTHTLVCNCLLISFLAIVILIRASRLAVFVGNTLPCMVETFNCRWKVAIIYYYDPIIIWWCVNYLLEVCSNTSQLHLFQWTLWLVELWVALLVVLLFGMYMNHIWSVIGDRCIERFVNYLWCLWLWMINIISCICQFLSPNENMCVLVQLCFPCWLAHRITAVFICWVSMKSMNL